MIRAYLAGKVGGPKWAIFNGIDGVEFSASDRTKHGEHGWGNSFYQLDDSLKSDLREEFLCKLWHCNLLVAYLDTPDSFGSIAEIATASTLGLPCHVIVKGKPSAERAEELAREDDYADVADLMEGCTPEMHDAYWFVCSFPLVTVYNVRSETEASNVAREFFDDIKKRRLWQRLVQPSRKQIGYLRSLGYDGPDPETKQLAGELIANFVD